MWPMLNVSIEPTSQSGMTALLHALTKLSAVWTALTWCTDQKQGRQRI